MPLSLDEMIDRAQFSLPQAEKEEALVEIFRPQLSNNRVCPNVASMYGKLGFDEGKFSRLDEIPYIPVNMFKRFDLITCDRRQIIRVLQSSATTSGTPSRVFLDKETAFRQSKALTAILKSFLGTKRRPFLVIDCPSSVARSQEMSARGAAISGVSVFARKTYFAFRDDMTLDVESLAAFCAAAGGSLGSAASPSAPTSPPAPASPAAGATGAACAACAADAAGCLPGNSAAPSDSEPGGAPAAAPRAQAAMPRISQSAADAPLAFGFTYIVWTKFLPALKRAGIAPALPSVRLLHSGGWKKLLSESVDKAVFSRGVARAIGAAPQNVIDFYGMAEQTGVVFIDCECGNKHAPDFADVVIRDFFSLREARFGEEGLIEVMSALPASYPGQAVLTEDIGVCLGVDDCPCGRRGKYFRFKSRVEKAEVRGCGDAFAERESQRR